MKRPLPIIMAVAALTFGVYAVFVQFAPFEVPTAQNQGDTNLIRVQDYLQSPDKKLVLAGSSLTFRLPKTTLGPDVANLALAGESAETGLQIIRDSGAHPAMVLVETNLLLRPANAALVESQLRWPERWLRTHFRVFRAGYDPVNLLRKGFLALLNKAEREVPIPADVTRQLIEAQRQEKSHPPPPEAIQKNLAGAAALVAGLQARGIRVGFFEMPIDPSLTNSPFDRALRRAVLQTFPADRFTWLALPGDVQTVDGIHLDAENAARLARLVAEWNRRQAP